MLVLGGCVAGIGPVIAVGSQATEHGEATLGLQLGIEGSVGPPFAEATVGAYWFQSHGFAYGGHFDIGWDAGYEAGQPGAFGGGFEIGGLRLADDVMAHEMLAIDASRARSFHSGLGCQDSNSSASLTVAIRWNPRGWAIALVPRLVATRSWCGFQFGS